MRVTVEDRDGDVFWQSDLAGVESLQIFDDGSTTASVASKFRNTGKLPEGRSILHQ